MEMRVITKEKDWLELCPSSEEYKPAVLIDDIQYLFWS